MGGAGARHQHQRPATGPHAQTQIVILVIEEYLGIEETDLPQRRHPHQQHRPREMTGREGALGRYPGVPAFAGKHALEQPEIVGGFDVTVGGDDGRAEQTGSGVGVGRRHQQRQRCAVDGGIGTQQQHELGVDPRDALVATGAESAIDRVADQRHRGQGADDDLVGVVVAGVVDHHDTGGLSHRADAGFDDAGAVMGDRNHRNAGPGVLRLRFDHASIIRPAIRSAVSDGTIVEAAVAMVKAAPPLTAVLTAAESQSHDLGAAKGLGGG